MADLVVTDVTKSYPTRAEPLEVLRGVSFELAAGENLAILGPSGCGKSTLLYIVGTLDAPTSGRVTLAGSNPFDLERAAAGRVSQSPDRLRLSRPSPAAPVLGAGQRAGAHAGRRPAQARSGRAGPHAVGSRRAEQAARSFAGGTIGRRAAANRDRPRAGQSAGAVVGRRADRQSGPRDAAGVGQLLLEMQAQEHTMLIVVTHSQELAGLLARRMELNAGRLE